MLSRYLLAFFGLVMAGCGQADVAQQVEFLFGPRALPDGTAKIQYYVLPSVLSDGSSAVCEDFTGPDRKRPLSYNQDIVVFGEEAVDQAGATTLVIGLEPGSYMFYIEARSASACLAYGCGEGAIEAGKKTYVTVRVVEGC